MLTFFEENSMAALSRSTQPTFEETFPKAPFSELVRLAMTVAERVVKLRSRLDGAAQTARTGDPATL